MKYAADFRQEARAALQGKWPLAILVGLVAAILGGATSGGPEFKIYFPGGSLHAMETLVAKAGGTVAGRMAVLAEGDAKNRDDIKFLAPLPTFKADGSVR